MARTIAIAAIIALAVWSVPPVYIFVSTTIELVSAFAGWAP